MLNASVAKDMSDSYADLSAYVTTEISRIESIIIMRAKTGAKTASVQLTIFEGVGSGQLEAYVKQIVDQIRELGYTATLLPEENIVDISWENA